MTPVELRWRSGELMITHPTKDLENVLHYMHKSLEQDPKKPWEKKTVKTKTPLFRVVQESGPRIVVTYQGLIDKAVDALKKANTPYVIYDQRLDFPNPKVHLTKGFRSTQFSTLMNLLKHNRSGIVKCPTRYGKTTLLVNTIRAFPGVKTVVTAPGADLLGQMVDELQAALPGREVKGIFTGSKGKKQSDDITVVSMDSLDKVDYEGTKLVLVDEVHAVASATRLVKMSKFKNARIYGYGATTEGRYDGADDVITGLIGPVLYAKTFQQAVAEGAICNIRVYVVKVPFDDFNPGNRDAAYRFLMGKNERFHKLVHEVTEHVIPKQWQTIVFIDESKQADILQEYVADAQVAIAMRLTGSERDEMFKKMVSGEIKRCLATNIYSTGVTFPDLRVVVNAAGGGGSITGTQKPGRLAQIRPGKLRGYLIDFVFECNGGTGGGKFRDQSESPDQEGPDDSTSNRKWQTVVRDCWARINNYKKLGYELVFVDSPSQIQLD